MFIRHHICNLISKPQCKEVCHFYMKHLRQYCYLFFLGSAFALFYLTICCSVYIKSCSNQPLGHLILNAKFFYFLRKQHITYFVLTLFGKDSEFYSLLCC